MCSTGGCLCGGVTYRVEGEVGQPLACHCSQCARTSGNFAAMARCRTADLVVTEAGALTWFESSSEVVRGFCGRCGGNLFWRQQPGEDTYITAGTLDRPTGLRLAEHIFVASKSDYYALEDGLPQKAEW